MGSIGETPPSGMMAEIPLEKPDHTFQITKEFLEKSLHKKVKTFHVSNGTNPGDNYLSILYGIRVDLAEDPKPLHLMLKVYPGHPARHAMLIFYNIFYIEAEVYGKLFPDLMTWQRERGCEFKLPFAGFVDGSGHDYWKNPKNEVLVQENFILMVDMKQTHGFKMADRMNGLDLAHAKCVLESLARFHAVGWGFMNNFNVSKREFMGLRPEVSGGFFNLKGETIVRQFVDTNSAMLLPLMDELLGAQSDIYLKLVNFFKEEDSAKRGLKYTDPEGEGINEAEVEEMLRIKPNTPIPCTEPWNVINHGDCWLNNILFKYKDATGEPIESIFVDLQGVNVGCPTMDLAYFIYTSLSTAIRRSHLQQLLEFYAEEFIRICKELGLSPMPGFCLETLKRRFHRSKPLGFLYAVVILPIIMGEECDDLEKADTKEGSEDINFLLEAVSERKVGKDSPIVKRIKEIVEDMYAEGIF